MELVLWQTVKAAAPLGVTQRWEPGLESRMTGVSVGSERDVLLATKLHVPGTRPGIVGRVAELLGPPAPRSFRGVVTAVINDIAAQPAGEDVLLFPDDYNLIGSLRVHESLAFLIEHLPAALTSRSGEDRARPRPSGRSSRGRREHRHVCAQDRCLATVTHSHPLTRRSQAAAAGGGPWLCRVLSPSGLVAVTVPSGCSTMPHPHRWIAIR